MTLADIGNVFRLGESIFPKVGFLYLQYFPYFVCVFQMAISFSRMWDEWEVVNAYSTYLTYSAVADIRESDSPSSTPNELIGFILCNPISQKSETLGLVSWIAVESKYRRHVRYYF